jgi:hypothetical protein
MMLMRDFHPYHRPVSTMAHSWTFPACGSLKYVHRPTQGKGIKNVGIKAVIVYRAKGDIDYPFSKFIFL